MSYKAGKVVIDIQADTTKLVTGMNKAEATVSKTVDDMKSSLKTLISAYAGFETAQKIFYDGFAYNSAIENAQAGLASLSVAVQDKSIPVMERYSIANIEAAQTLERLQEINAQTPHTLDETNQIYKAMYVSMSNAGASTSEMIELTRSLSIASGAAGIEFNSLLAGVDGLATGTVLANSDLGRFLSALGLTNEKLKESDDVVKLLNETMKDFKAADTMTVAVSQLDNAWSQLAGELTKPLFEQSKEDIKAISLLLQEATHWTHEWNIQQQSMRDIKYHGSIDDINIKLKQYKEELKDLNRGDWVGANALKSNVQIADERIKLEHKIRNLTKKLDEKELYEKKLKIQKISEFQKAEALKLENSKKASSTKISPAKKTGPSKASSSKADLEEQSALEAEFAALLESNYTTALDYQIDLAESANLWQNGLEGVAGAMMNVGNTANKLYISNMKAAKAEDEINKKYAKSFVKYQKDPVKIRELQKNQELDLAKIKEQQSSNELAAYSSLAGSMASYYEEGSKGAIAMTAAQSALGIASSYAAIASAWNSGFTIMGKIAAAAIVTANVMPLIQQLSASGGGSGGASASSVSTYDYQSEIDSASFTTGENTSFSDYDNNFDKFIEGLDSASEKLEAFGSDGTALSSTLESLYEAYYDSIDKRDSASEVIQEFEVGKTDDLNTWYITGDLLNALIDENEAIEAIEGLNSEISSIITDSLSDSLDYSLLSLEELTSLTDGFDTEAYNAAVEEINDYAITAKLNGGVLSPEDQAALTELYTSDIYKLGNDYADALSLIDEALQTSTDNIKAWKDSFKSDEELLSDMASELSYTTQETVTSQSLVGYEKQTTSWGSSYYTPIYEDIETLVDVLKTPEIARTQEELDSLFESLSGGIDGLTYAELEFLNANQDLIDATQSIYEDVLDGWMTSLEDASSRIEDTADSLRSFDESSSVEDYYASMKATTDYLSSGDYDAFNDSLNETIALTSVLKDSSNFNSQRDMEFNQLVAASQFDTLDVSVNDELDVLKQIAEDTSKSYQIQQDTLDIQIEQANEIVKMRKEIEDLRDEMAS